MENWKTYVILRTKHTLLYHFFCLLFSIPPYSPLFSCYNSPPIIYFPLKNSSTHFFVDPMLFPILLSLAPFPCVGLSAPSSFRLPNASNLFPMISYFFSCWRCFGFQTCSCPTFLSHPPILLFCSLNSSFPLLCSGSLLSTWWSSLLLFYPSTFSLITSSAPLPSLVGYNSRWIT